ncbi:hypothetical protein [Pontivivens ytuae]|uniref:Uncharacterized protein n=1 Tax=Pontivivens ytuae TaxID=2789856 RepID=A0A7S9LRR4_9RHOB|nr:hypothetical protein [Pontivivens ytuae]QPH54043.1 hypothetical protein I0K15_20100 [Pontivivens ytuae]
MTGPQITVTFDYRDVSDEDNVFGLQQLDAALTETMTRHGGRSLVSILLTAVTLAAALVALYAAAELWLWSSEIPAVHQLVALVAAGTILAMIVLVPVLSAMRMSWIDIWHRHALDLSETYGGARTVTIGPEGATLRGAIDGVTQGWVLFKGLHRRDASVVLVFQAIAIAIPLSKLPISVDELEARVARWSEAPRTRHPGPWS